MRIVFMGYGELGANVLRGLAPHHEVMLVLTHEAHFTGLGEADVDDAAADLGLPVLHSPRAAEPGVHARVRAAGPDVIVSTNWRTTVPPEVLCIPRLGALNVHDALLPRYAGFGAVNWAIRNGEHETGLTVHFMDEKLDTGPVVTRSTVAIGPDDTAGQVLARLKASYVPTLLGALDQVSGGSRGEPQGPDGSFYHRIRLTDTRIDWRDGTQRLHDLVRGQSDPFVNAWTTHDGLRLFIKAAAPPERAWCGTPGRIIAHAEGGVAVACGRTPDEDSRGLILLQVQTEGGPAVRAVDYFVRGSGYLT
jgi:methionyl-tRNA formyltransferase